MDGIESKPPNVRQSLQAYSSITSIFSHCMFSLASEARDKHGNVLPCSILLTMLLCLGSYKEHCTQLLKVLHKCCNMDVLIVLLIYPHSPLGATPSRVLRIYQTNPSLPCYNIIRYAST